MPKLLGALQESTSVIQNRSNKLGKRTDGIDMTDEIMRKVALTISEIDQILA